MSDANNMLPGANIEADPGGKTMSFSMWTTPGSTVHITGNGGATSVSGVADSNGLVQIRGIPSPLHDVLIQLEGDKQP